jgi:His-Xaa-Ser system radical SAM maturase HxsB
MRNHFYGKPFGKGYLITNDAGYYQLLSRDDYYNLCVGKETTCQKELIEKKFIYDTEPELFINDFKTDVHDFKKYLFSATSLHIFVVTSSCNQSCVYCQASVNKKSHGMMSKETAKLAVDFALSASVEHLTFEFQGGEPLTNFDTIKYIVEYAEEIRGDKKITYNIVSNLLLLDDEMTGFFKLHSFCVSTSIDGPSELHNKNRPASVNAFAEMARGLLRLRKAGVSVNAIQTTTRNSLPYAKEIVDVYVALGFHDIFARPLTKLGFANERWDEIGYSPEEFTRFYRQITAYISILNSQEIEMRESHAQILRKKILGRESVNYMELRSPCGAVVGQLAYNYDGKIYTCDEARMLGEMGDDSFMLGRLGEISYFEALLSPICKSVCSASCLESIPLCSDCVYSPYCGVCPVVNYSESGGLFAQMPNNYRCKIYKGIMEVVFENILETAGEKLEDTGNA